MIENIKNSVKINEHAIIQISTFTSIFLVFFPFRYTNILVSILLTIGIALTLFEISKSKDLLEKFINPYLIMMVIGILWSLITYFWIIDLQSWQQANLYFYIGLGFTFTISYLIRDKNFLKLFSAVISISLIIHNLIGWFEIFTKNYLFFDNLESLDKYRLMSLPATFFYNTNDFAFYLLFGLIVLLFLNIEDPDGKTQKYTSSIRIILTLSTSLLIYFTQSRIIQVCLVLAFALFLFFKIRNYKTRKVVAQVSLAIGVIIAIIVWINVEVIIQTIQNDPSGEVRVNLSISALKLIEDTNYIGVGAGSIAYNLANFDSYRVGGITALHNWWLELFAMYGIVFFGVYVVYYILQLIKSSKEAIQNRDSTAILGFVWLVLYIPASFASSTNFDDPWIWMVHSFVFILLTTVKSQLTIKDKVFKL